MNPSKAIILFAALIISYSAFAKKGNLKIPKTWAKDFTISLSYHNSMGGASTKLKITYDSSVYTSVSRNDHPGTKRYLMTEEDRVNILKKLSQMKADAIKSENNFATVHDGWSQSICFGLYCIQGGSGIKMSDDDKNRFLEVYDYLEQFAIDKVR